jgi:hypothetical protein
MLQTYLVNLHDDEQVVPVQVNLVSRTNNGSHGLDDSISCQLFVVANRWPDGELCITAR